MKKNPISKINKLLLTLSPIELSLLSYFLGILFSYDLNGNELEALGNFYQLLGQTISTIGSQVELSETKYNINIDEMYETIKNKIGNIESIIAEFKNL